MTSPAVTVVIPTRNCLDLLPNAVRSALGQDVQDIEVIVVDDGSTDGTQEWLADAHSDEPRVRAIALGGVGVQAARMVAIEQARAPLIAFLDADDTWRRGKLRRQLAFHAANPDAVLSFTDYMHIDPQGGTHGTCFEFWPRFQARMRNRFDFMRLGADARAAILAENVVGTSTVVASRAALLAVGGFDKGLPSASDWDLWLKLAARGAVGCTGEVLADYLMRPGSMTSNRGRRIAAMRAIIQRHGEDVTPSARRVARSRLAVAVAEQASATGRRRVAAMAHLKAFALCPSVRNGRAAARAGFDALYS
jgi:glycosyltransferase involved in cell wall biosynthesis